MNIKKELEEHLEDVQNTLDYADNERDISILLGAKATTLAALQKYERGIPHPTRENDVIYGIELDGREIAAGIMPKLKDKKEGGR